MASIPEVQQDNPIQSPWISITRWRMELQEILTARVRERQLGYRQTWYLGALTLGAFTIQLITGLLLMFYYHPSIPQAYTDMKDLQFVVSFGPLLRSLHRWSAHAMVFLVFVHMAKVFYRGAYRPPRQLNWIVGLGLLQLTLLLSYTGYLLPWDQLSFWGTTVGSNIMSSIPYLGDKLRFIILGGHGVNANFLLRFYVLHTLVLPLAVISLVVVHIWRLHRDGGMYSAHEARAMASQPDSSDRSAHQETTLPYWELLFREVIGIQMLAVVLIWIAQGWHAPLEQLADPSHTPNPAKAPWYFSGLQELLHYFPPFVAGIILPGLVMTALVIVPFFRVNIERENMWARNKWRRLLIVTAIVILLSGLLLYFHAWVPLVPIWVVGAAMGISALNSSRQGNGLRMWLGSRPLSFWIMTWFLAEAVTLTTVGTLFRGPGWLWVWPWRS
jgi:quinol-cytochrome oxidoreductase complex cytochrome b subunit